MVTIYTTTHCPYCKMAKDYFTERDVSYREVNVEADDEAAAEMIRKSGQMGVPVIEVKGTVIVGFDRDAIERALEA
ncbi:MAG: Uxx-star family glutaredoxin-like (seleno)protein [Candidatus Paceibacterota bacterium]